LKISAQKGVESSLSGDYVPKLGKTVTYIAAAVLFNENNEVLMMQEAKSRYAGQWYLPAGRVDPNEQIVDAVKREVKEETGLVFEPTSLILVESSQSNWFRFTFVGHIVGGKLKTVAMADSESLQANWVQDINQLSLRAPDCLRLIDFGRQYHQLKESWHKPQFPVIEAHNKMLLRIVCAVRRKEKSVFYIFLIYY
jgi:8-oxo-dGDP phosphatase